MAPAREGKGPDAPADGFSALSGCAVSTRNADCGPGADLAVQLVSFPAVDQARKELPATGARKKARVMIGGQRPGEMSADSNVAAQTGPWTVLSCVIASCSGCGCRKVSIGAGIRFTPHFVSIVQAREELTCEWGWACTPRSNWPGDDELLCPPDCARAGNDPGKPAPAADKYRNERNLMAPATVARMLAAMLDSYMWDVWRHGVWDDLLVTDPPATRTYLIGLSEGQDPVHLDDIARLKRAAARLGGQVTPVLITSQPVTGKITELGVRVLQATGSDEQTALTALRFLRQEEG